MTKTSAKKLAKPTRPGARTWGLALSTAVALAGCSTSSNYAPVVYHHKGQTTGGAPVLSQGDPANKAYSASYRPVRSSSRGVQSQTLAPVPSAPMKSVEVQPSYLEPAPETRQPRPLIVADHAPVPEGINRPYEITVQPGDTVYSLARAHDVERDAIIDYNDLYAPYNLRVGEVLLIPKGQAEYFVKSGDTLYGIARSTGTDAREIAVLNSLSQPYTLSVGQQLRLPPPRAEGTMLAGDVEGSVATGGPFMPVDKSPARDLQKTTPPENKRSATVAPTALIVPQPVPPVTRGEVASEEAKKSPPANSDFVWPVSGRIISGFGPKEAGRRNDGLNISVPSGTAVRAARAGEVIYTGNELKGYGNLILVRHDGGYVSAYAHNSRLLVKRGDYVRQGQHIADSGQTGSVTEPQVHFEIRKDKKPINPMAYLPKV